MVYSITIQDFLKELSPTDFKILLLKIEQNQQWLDYNWPNIEISREKRKTLSPDLINFNHFYNLYRDFSLIGIDTDQLWNDLCEMTKKIQEKINIMYIQN